MAAHPVEEKLIILSAPSGAGKSTIAKHLLNSGLNLMFSISACSRQKREGESDGIDYYFFSPDEFRRHISDEKFLEWEEVYPDHYYGTLKSEIKRITQSDHHVLFDVDVIGGLNIKRHYKDKALAIFVKPPGIKELEERLIKRSTDSAERIRMRLDKAGYEMSFAPEFDIVITNDKLEVAVKEAIEAVKRFLSSKPKKIQN